MNLITRLAISTLVIFAMAYVLPGVNVDGWTAALIVALVLGIVNTFIKPILVILTLPITIITLGLFTLVIQALMVLLVEVIVPGFEVDGFLWALVFGVVLAVVNFAVKRFD